MKITLLEPLGIPAAVLAGYAARLEAQGHTFVSFDTRDPDPAELARRTGDSDIAILANTPYPAQVVEQAKALKLLDVAFTGVDHVALDACRKQGVAGKLLQVFLDFAEGNHLAFLSLEVRASNYDAIALYGSRGFRSVGRRKNYYEHPREDAIIMTKEFEHHGTETPVS